jgi:hypothetical protein
MSMKWYWYPGSQRSQQGVHMSTSSTATALVSLAIAAAFAGGVCAQIASPRDAVRPEAAGVAGPVASPRDGDDRKDYDKDKSDADLAIERDKCGEFAEEDRARCIREARAQRDSIGPSRYYVPSRGTAAAPATGGMRR